MAKNESRKVTDDTDGAVVQIAALEAAEATEAEPEDDAVARAIDGDPGWEFEVPGVEWDKVRGVKHDGKFVYFWPHDLDVPKYKRMGREPVIAGRGSPVPNGFEGRDGEMVRVIDHVMCRQPLAVWDRMEKASRAKNSRAENFRKQNQEDIALG